MREVIPPWVEQVLSGPRFAPYLVTAGDVEAAIALYRWNVEVAAAFVVPLHWVETAARNGMHARLVRYFGVEHWWDVAPLDHDGRRKVADATKTLQRRRKDPTIADAVVAELNFGFWVSLLAGRYHRTLWVPALTRVFPRRSRKEVHFDFSHVLTLRNRIMHHEPIHHRHLTADHATLCRLIAQLSPEALVEVRLHDQVHEVLARRQKP